VLIIIDDVLSGEEQEKLQALFSADPEVRKMRWINGSYDDVKNNPSPIAKLLALAKLLYLLDANVQS